MVKLLLKLLWLFIIELASFFDGSYKSTFLHLCMADNVFRCLSVVSRYYKKYLTSYNILVIYIQSSAAFTFSFLKIFVHVFNRES